MTESNQTPSPRQLLDDHYRDIIARARELAVLPAGELCEHMGEALGRAQFLLGELASIVARLAGQDELRDALAAIREALDIPHAATAGDDEIRAKILDERTRHAVVMLRGILGEDATADIPWLVAYLRGRLAEHPAAGYKTWDERIAELEAAKVRATARGPA